MLVLEIRKNFIKEVAFTVDLEDGQGFGTDSESGRKKCQQRCRREKVQGLMKD